MIDLILQCIGGATIGGVVGYLLYYLGQEIKRIHRVAKHYHAVAESPDYYFGDTNHFRAQDKIVRGFQDRIYTAQRDAGNAIYRVAEHEKTFKHTKQSKKRVRK